MALTEATDTKDPAPGRSCPLRYRHGATALASAPEHAADTLYVVGGFYGNLPALEALRQLAAREAAPATLCFNGDFNWFNVDAAGFVAINRAVLAHDACLGNMEAELLSPDDEAGCGCAYPESVDAGTVDRSNRIHARLKQTAQAHPDLRRQLGTLPMVRRYRVGDAAIGVVHGDAESPAPTPALYGCRLGSLHIDALPLDYDCVAWEAAFLANWPPGSPAHVSYYRRIVDGPDHALARAAAPTR